MVGIVELAPLEGKKIVIAAAQAVGIRAADFGPRIIDSAIARYGVEELTDLLEYVVLFMAKHPVAIGDLCITHFGLLVSYAEMSSHPLYILARGFDSIIAATVSWTLRAIEQHSQFAISGIGISVFDGTHRTSLFRI